MTASAVRAALAREADADRALSTVLAEVGDQPADLVAVFATTHHRDALVRIGARLSQVFPDAAFLGGVAGGVVGPGAEVEEGPGLVVLAAATGVSPRSFHATVARDPQGRVGIIGWPRASRADLVVATVDARRFPVSGVLGHVAEADEGPSVAGGLLDAGEDVDGPTLLGPGGVAVLGGATGVVLPGLHARTRTSQGCAPVGQPLAVTAAEGTHLRELAGRPAAGVLAELFANADDEQRARLQGGLQLGIALPDRRGEYGVGDFLVRGLLGTDPATGALVVGATVEVGQVVQFHVRDAATARADLHTRLAGGDDGRGALLFTCTGRGRRLFGAPDHDAIAVTGRFGTVAGAFCAGEIGVVGGRSHVHGLTATFVAPLATVDSARSRAGAVVP